MKFRKTAIYAALASTFFLVACGGGGGEGASTCTYGCESTQQTQNEQQTNSTVLEQPSNPASLEQPEIKLVSASQTLASQEKLSSGKTFAIRTALSTGIKYPASVSTEIYSSTGELLFKTASRVPQKSGNTLSNDHAYVATIPGDYASEGNYVKVVTSQDGVEYSKNVFPVFSKNMQGVKIKIVPVVTANGSIPGFIPTQQQVIAAVKKYTPLPDNTQVEILNSFQSQWNFETLGQWIVGVNELRTLSQLDQDSQSIYFGIVAHQGTTINGLSQDNSNYAIGWDKESEWSKVFIHELGHLFNTNHTACGGADRPDLNFPYDSPVPGYVGNNKPFDITTGLVEETEQYDVMGYCGGTWFSDYNYNKFLEAAEVKYN